MPRVLRHFRGAVPDALQVRSHAICSRTTRITQIYATPKLSTKQPTDWLTPVVTISRIAPSVPGVTPQPPEPRRLPGDLSLKRSFGIVPGPQAAVFARKNSDGRRPLAR